MSDYPFGGEPPVQPEGTPGVQNQQNPVGNTPADSWTTNTSSYGGQNYVQNNGQMNPPIQNPVPPTNYGTPSTSSPYQAAPMNTGTAPVNPYGAAVPPTAGGPPQMPVGQAYGYGSAAPMPQMAGVGMYPQKKKSVFPKILLIILVLVLAVVGFFVYQNSSTSSNSFFGNSLDTINNYIINHQDAQLKEYIAKNPSANLNEFTEEELSPVYTAISYENSEALKILLEAGADPNLKDTYGDESLTTSPLFYAIYCENTDAIKVLVENGGKVNISTSGGYTPLMMATYNNLEDITILEEAGADTNAVDSYGWNLLHYAAYSGNTEMYDHFVELGVDESALNANGYNMAHVALLGNEMGMVSYLEEKGILLSANTVTNGDTLLHIAGGTEAVSYVFDNFDVDVNAVNGVGETALSYNCEIWDIDGITMALEAGTDPNIQDNKGRTVLMYASGNDDADAILLLLLEYGADTSITDNEGYTAYDFAENMGLADSTMKKLQPSLSA